MKLIPLTKGQFAIVDDQDQYMRQHYLSISKPIYVNFPNTGEFSAITGELCVDSNHQYDKVSLEVGETHDCPK